jgi:bifunctional DNA-binding transcriptional regulator/antitoxin component of YhaV-PrlF toxin-antitoxin module
MTNKRLYLTDYCYRITVPVAMVRHIGAKQGDFITLQEAPNGVIWMYKLGGKEDEHVSGSVSKDERSDRA